MQDRGQGYRKPYGRHRDRYGGRGYKPHGGGRERTGPRQQRPPQRPMPIGDKCNPLCPFFICTKRAKVIMNEFYRGRAVKVAYCRLFGGKCIGASCKYAACRINAMLPDGRCAKAIKFEQKGYSDEELMKDVQELEDYDIDEFT